MAFNPTQFPRVLTIYLELSNYPILAPKIRERMRQELFRRKVISQKDLEAEVEQKAIQSQYREGLLDPFFEEAPDIWLNRTAIVREHLTDFYFAYNLPHDLFEKILREVLEKRMPSQDIVLTFHPELAPWDMLYAQGEAYEALSSEERLPIEHHLKEIKVVLIKAMISDHLEYVGIAKDWFDVSDLKAILGRRFGRGKIGGKAAGVMLAEAILRKSGDPDLTAKFTIPRSWFLGSDVFYQFTQLNDFLDFSNQKYKSEEEVRNEYPEIRSTFHTGRFPEEIIKGLRSILEDIGSSPLIVRSSSLLEDSFGTSFAGKYESHFCGNQGNFTQNLQALLAAISSIYASLYSPDVILYRKRMGLLDYDERMAILIQEVVGRKQGTNFFPDGAGVGFSQNQFRWNPRIDRHSGFLRLVWGLGTRAVNTFGGDYPRLVALSHPQLRPEVDPQRIRQYSQHQIDLIDLEANAYQTLPVSEAIDKRSPFLRYLAQQFIDDHFRDFFSQPLSLNPDDAVITFNGLLCGTEFAGLMRKALHTLESAYGRPVDIEFAIDISSADDASQSPHIHILQCRPQSQLQAEEVRLPTDIPQEKIIFMTDGMVPDGTKSKVRYAVYIHDKKYYALHPEEQKKLARLIGRINGQLAEESFILIGPGRWGSVNPEMGIPVTYGDLHNTCALIEVVSRDAAIEPSYGTHFFQDLIEAQIFILALSLDDPSTEFNRSFFLESENMLTTLMPETDPWTEIVRIIDIPRVTDGKRLDLVMDGDEGKAIAYLNSDP
jgi:hypothetical protein